MEAKSFLFTLGLVFAIMGVVLAQYVDKILGVGFVVVGAFLLMLPFARPSD